MTRLFKILSAFVLLAVLAAAPVAAQDKSLTVFAAASLKNALDDINAAYTAKTGVRIAASYAASSALARQIEQDAPADVFASADLEWMDYVIGKKAVNEASKVDLLGNRIVLIAPKDSPVSEVKIESGFDLARLAGDGRIATGDVQAVPVGKYAKAALEKLGAWQAASTKFAMAENVRAALTLVARKEAVLGIVYETDAKADKQVKVVDFFGGDSHSPIVYPVAPVEASKNADKDAFVKFLLGPEATKIFMDAGFTILTAS